MRIYVPINDMILEQELEAEFRSDLAAQIEATFGHMRDATNPTEDT